MRTRSKASVVQGPREATTKAGCDFDFSTAKSSNNNKMSSREPQMSHISHGGCVNQVEVAAEIERLLIFLG